MPNRHAILLAAVNARYSHAAFGLRCLWTNLGPLRARAEIREFTLAHAPLEIAEALLADDPEVIGFGVYIWNVTLITQVVQTIKAVRPGVIVVVGGPEASYEYEGTPLFDAADYLVRGEGEVAFAQLSDELLAGRRPSSKVIQADPPDLAQLALPYEAYTDEDIARRVLYVEASRGCPFRCEFCLSAVERGVRDFPVKPFLDEMERLMDRGAWQFKFVDRTFNLREDRCQAVLDFFQARWRDGMRLHFEIVPDRLSASLLDRIAAFPAGGLHLEVGVQTLNSAVQEAISRRQDIPKTVANLDFLRTRTQAVLHADLVAGLPGESWESFAHGFDVLISLAPHEVQVGILKRLKGAPIARHAEPHAMAFATHPPYEVLQTDLLDFAQLQRIKRFARYFDLYYNAGNFPGSLPMLWRTRPSAFEAFMAFSDALWAAAQRTHEIPLADQARYLYRFLLQSGIDDPSTIAAQVESDFRRLPGRKDRLCLEGLGSRV